MIVYNYTKIQRREKRVYSLFDTTISSQGISMSVVRTIFGTLAVFNFFGLLLCLITGNFYYSPSFLIDGSSSGKYFYMFFILLPIFIGVFLDSYKIQSYRAVDYFKLYLQPKFPIDHNNKRVKLYSYKVEGFVERM